MILVADNLTVSATLDGARVPVINGLSFTLAPGKVLGLVGESGAGKSMVGRTVAQLLGAAYIDDWRLMYVNKEAIDLAAQALIAQHRIAVTREINDGLLSPRFAPSQRAWVLSGTINPVNPAADASIPQDGDNR